MNHIELYIDKQLCDIQNPTNLGVRLNRILINPAELQMKDAQYSYSVTIPSTPVNDAIFRYTNVEEVKNKFNYSYQAQLYVDSILIFDGNFRLSEIDAEGNYKGNLLVPVPKTVKELFGDKMMNQIGEWKFYLTPDQDPEGEPMGMVEMLNTVNEAPGTPDCIFPLVLYGLLPKVAEDAEGTYSEKDTWDETVRLGVQDFAPSINCLAAIRKIFENYNDGSGESCTIGGTAFNDPRLTNLYMSYSNPNDYEQQWNWAHLGKLTLKGTWHAAEGDKGLSDFESTMVQTKSKQYNAKGEEETKPTNVVNLFSARNAKVRVEKDEGYNVFQYESVINNEKIQHTNVTIPVSGMYKITLDANLEIVGTTEGDFIGSSLQKNYADMRYNKHGFSFVYGNANDIAGKQGVGCNLFHDLRAEIKLVKSNDKHELDITEQSIDGLFFRGNYKQLCDSNNQKDANGYQKFNTYPKYFPQEESVLWVDPYQNPNFVCGFHWGKRNQNNPVDLRDQPCYRMVAKSGISWSTENDDVVYAVANSQSYLSYRPIVDASSSEEELDDEVVDVKDLGYVDDGKFAMTLNEAKPKDSIIREYQNSNKSERGEGLLHAVVWLDKGDKLSLIDVTDAANWNNKARDGYFVNHRIEEYTLTVEPYKKSTDWASVKMDGTGAKEMVWGDDSDFTRNYIDLSQFLPSAQKVDEWLENFCKAFNLDLLQPQARQFELNLKRSARNEEVLSVFDLDHKLSIRKRSNEALGLPSEIHVSFKVDQAEEGYDQKVRLSKEKKDPSIVPDSGSGSIATGSLYGNVLTQSSSFSYNWFKTLNCNVNIDGVIDKQEINFPIISDSEPWAKKSDRGDYPEMMQKTYTAYPQRFWYRTSNGYNVGAIWKDRYLDVKGNLDEEDKVPDRLLELLIYPLSNSYGDKNGKDYLELHYRDEPYSILRSYFTLLTTEDSHYTLVECRLSPDEYAQLAAGKLVSLNSDVYYVSAIENYDPMGRNLTKLKLIRKL